MSFLLDTDTCSAHLKRPKGLMHRFSQYSGRLYISTTILGELFAWAFIRADTQQTIVLITSDLLTEVTVLDYDSACSFEFGRLRGIMQKKGIAVSRLDLQIAATALVHNLTLVTHNTADFQNIPNLRLDDWLVP